MREVKSNKWLIQNGNCYQTNKNTGFFIGNLFVIAEKFVRFGHEEKENPNQRISC